MLLWQGPRRISVHPRGGVHMPIGDVRGEVSLLEDIPVAAGSIL